VDNIGDECDHFIFFQSGKDGTHLASKVDVSRMALKKEIDSANGN
jgi:hypothetical protein